MKYDDKYIDPRRLQELKDSRMIRHDHTDFANAPTKAIHHEWPKSTSWESVGEDPGIF